jgi:hypothetical protein
MERAMSDSKKAKEARMRAALSNKEGDQVPISDFFWTGFLLKAKEKWGQNLDIYRKFDLDYIIVNPNMDPVIQDFEILEDDGVNIKLRTGFGATIRRSGSAPMPQFDSVSVNEPEDMEKFVIESAKDKRRLYRAGDDQLNGVGDAIGRNIPSWTDRVDAYCQDFPVFGSVCEGYEYLWRCIGTENSLVWMLTEPELFGAFMKRIGDFCVELAEYQIEESRGRLSGMYIWGDVAYVNGMFFSPACWREFYKPIVEKIIKVCKKAGLMTVYHGCGNAKPIFNDFVEMGLDGYNPLECKAHLDAVELKKEYSEKLCFVGNFDVRELESGNQDRIKREVLYKLQCAVGGSWICQSDHSVSSGVSPESYEYMVNLLRTYGKYPLDMARIKKDLKSLEEKV